MKKSFFFAALALVAACAVFFAFENERDKPVPANGRKGISIVATMFPQYDLARAVAKDRAEITMLVRPGAEVHSFEPTPADVTKVRSADLFIVNGGSVDSWAEKLLSGAKSGEVKVIRFMDVLPAHGGENGGCCGCGHCHEHSECGHGDGGCCCHGEYADEHVWTSPANQLKILAAVADAICTADPENCDYYRKNESEYAERLRELDGSFREAAESGKRKLLLFGDRFPFHCFVEEYGLEYRAAFKGCGAHSDVSASAVADLIDTVRRENLPAVFRTETANPAVAQTISEQTGVPMLLFHSCHNLTLEEFESGETYVSLMEKNLENVRKGLN